MIAYSSRFLVRSEVWFDEEPADVRSSDVVLFHLRSRPAAGTKWRYFYNYCIDLTESTERLTANLNRDTAYKIRRARDRDGIVCACCDERDPATLDQFEEMYNAFASMKGMTPLNRPRVETMAAAGALDLSVAKDPQGRALVYHAMYRDRHRATELYLPSLFRGLVDSKARNLVGRANRYLTWSDILRYQEEGLTCFDFGGWYPGTADGQRLKINEFKRGFGGTVLREYECERILTIKGWVALRAGKLLKRAKLASSRAAPAETQTPGRTMSGVPYPSEQAGATVR